MSARTVWWARAGLGVIAGVMIWVAIDHVRNGQMHLMNWPVLAGMALVVAAGMLATHWYWKDEKGHMDL